MRGRLQSTSGGTGTVGLVHYQERMAEDVHTDAGRLIGLVVGGCGNSFMIASIFLAK